MKKILLKIFFCVLIIVSFILIFGYLIEPNRLKTNEIWLKFNVDDKWNGFKIVHISDIHYLKSIDDAYLEKVLNEVNLINPDILIITGDLLNNNVTYNNENLAKLKEVLSNFKTKYGKFIIKGDNDTSEYYNDVIKESNFTSLDNTSKYLFNEDSTPILISGTDKVDSEFEPCLKILVTHKPDEVDNINYKNFDLVLAGHSMGGIKLPFIPRIGYIDGGKKYLYGEYKLSDTTLYVSNGIGTNETGFRFMNTPSINFYRIIK